MKIQYLSKTTDGPDPRFLAFILLFSLGFTLILQSFENVVLADTSDSESYSKLSDSYSDFHRSLANIPNPTQEDVSRLQEKIVVPKQTEFGQANQANYDSSLEKARQRSIQKDRQDSIRARLLYESSKMEITPEMREQVRLKAEEAAKETETSDSKTETVSANNSTQNKRSAAAPPSTGIERENFVLDGTNIPKALYYSGKKELANKPTSQSPSHVPIVWEEVPIQESETPPKEVNYPKSK